MTGIIIGVTGVTSLPLFTLGRLCKLSLVSLSLPPDCCVLAQVLAFLSFSSVTSNYEVPGFLDVVLLVNFFNSIVPALKTKY